MEVFRWCAHPPLVFLLKKFDEIFRTCVPMVYVLEKALEFVHEMEKTPLKPRTNGHDSNYISDEFRSIEARETASTAVPRIQNDFEELLNFVAFNGDDHCFRIKNYPQGNSPYAYKLFHHLVPRHRWRKNRALNRT